MEHYGYKELAKYYDLFYSKKNYDNETEFIIKLLKDNNCNTILDVGCGTGNHILRLEKLGYKCMGIDLNKEMLDIAKQKVSAPLFVADMTKFNLGMKFDAVICMFAAFNHIVDNEDAKRTLSNFYNHLKPNGIVIIDLHNPLTNGEKEDDFGTVKRIMKWQYNSKEKLERSSVKFITNDRIIEDNHIMRIYNVELMKKMCKTVGFKSIIAYEGYGFEPVKSDSKNIEIIIYK